MRTRAEIEDGALALDDTEWRMELALHHVQLEVLLDLRDQQGALLERLR